MQERIGKLKRMSDGMVQDSTRKKTEIIKGDNVTKNVTPAKTKTGYVNGKAVDLSTLTQGGKAFKPYKAAPTPKFKSK